MKDGSVTALLFVTIIPGTLVIERGSVNYMYAVCVWLTDIFPLGTMTCEQQKV